MDMFFNSLEIKDYIWCFVIGGIICIIGQILIDKTKFTSARILVLFVTIRSDITVDLVYMIA